MHHDEKLEARSFNERRASDFEKVKVICYEVITRETSPLIALSLHSKLN